MLRFLGKISGKQILPCIHWKVLWTFQLVIDGTKIESVANRYTFVWKKAVTKNQKRLCDRTQKTATGYRRITSVYQCSDCKGCPLKTKCIKGNNSKVPMERRSKTLYVSKTMKQKRAEDLERITGDYGTHLRMNRSIQAEGSFADMKADMAFRRYSYRGMDNLTAQSVILAIAHNMNKLHNKIQSGRTG